LSRGSYNDIQQRTEAIVSRDFVGALLQLNAEKQISREQLIGAVEDGIQSAYRRVAGDEDIHVRIDAETGKIRVYRARRVVDEIEDELTEMTIEQAKAFDSTAGVGDLVETEELDGDVFGRIGAQTAKQIVLQRIREVERDQVFDQFASREGELMTGTVNRVEPRAIILDVGKNVEAILATTEQSALEHYRIGQNVKAFVLEVRRSTRGPQIFVSRTHKGFLKRLFELEVPEIHSGTVEIKAIAREAGSRSKVAVASRQEGLDPVGATVGQRGARVQAVVAELSGEKIDVIPWNDDPAVFVANALSPAQVISVDIDEEHRIASVTVPERMLSLAIGREGQNARLAARLSGWRIDIRSDVSVAEAKAAAEAPEEAVEAVATGEAPGSEPGDAAAAKIATKTPTKPKRVTKKAAAEAAVAAAATEVPAETAEAPAKPKRVTKKAAAAAPAVTEPAADVRVEAAAAPPPKPKRAAKKKAEVTEEVAS
jgi:N utilization substance protein A